MAHVTIKGLHKHFGAVHVVKGIDLAIADGEFAVLVGPSGCGKSTLLRTIAGLEQASEGTIEIAGKVVNDMRPRDRDVAMVFQDYALYPHMTVAQNIGFGLRARNFPRAEIETRVRRAAAMLNIDQLLERLPRQLSGGQRQRVAIGRAIVRNPQIFLFDEPLSNLDAQLRDEMRSEIKRLHQELGATMIYVTHDQTEAMTLASKIVVLNHGHIAQIGSPVDLYNKPADRFVASFIGSPAMNFLPSSILGFTPQGVTEVGIRPEHVKLAEPRKGTKNLAGTIQLVERLGNATAIHVETPAGTVTALTGPESEASAGTEIGLIFDTGKMIGFDADGKAKVFGIK